MTEVATGEISAIGIYGLGIMGQNLALNLSGRGYSVSVCNRSENGEEFVTETFLSSRCHGLRITGFADIKGFVQSLSRPRKVLLMVKSGQAVDSVLELLIPFLEAGDIVIDGGNSHYRDTARRLAWLEEHSLLYVGCGISGGADGALNGSALMPGGTYAAWEQIRGMLNSISAVSQDGTPCCNWIGSEGSGHFVKMVHNGIEYALMQMLAEVYDVMKRGLLMSSDEIHAVFNGWHKEELHSFLLEITLNVLKELDADGSPLIDRIRDSAAHKGTGKECSIAALEAGVPTPAISEAIQARFLSAMTDLRSIASRTYCRAEPYAGNRDILLKALREALYCSQLMAYLQGLSLITRVSEEYGWQIHISSVVQIWRSGCIIQSEMLNRICDVLGHIQSVDVFLESSVVEILKLKQAGWREAVICAVKHGIPVPAISSSLSYFDGMRSEHLPTCLIQAQRDCFGAHGYERTDSPVGAIFHTEWGRERLHEDL